jgi:SAM-dependent methyltransferase
MLPDTAQALLQLNRRFYAEYGPAFAATRRRIQDGVRRVLESLPDMPGARWLDLGCGSGALAAAWLSRGRQSSYLGLDFSPTLLAEARASVAGMAQAGQVAFAQADLSAEDWDAGLQPGFAGALSFAVFHHLPSRALRERVLRQVHALLAPGGLFIHSEWQFQHSPKLMARRLPWSAAGLGESALEPGDTLLDWRFQLPGSAEGHGLRYVHLFTREELAALAEASGFRVLSEFESDGQGGRLGLYQVWEKT